MWLKKKYSCWNLPLPKKPSLFAGALNVQRKEEEFIKKKKNTTASDEDEFGAKFGWLSSINSLCPPEEA